MLAVAVLAVAALAVAEKWAEEVEGDKAIVEKRKSRVRSRRKLFGILDRCDLCHSDDPHETACGFSNGSTINTNLMNLIRIFLLYVVSIRFV